MAIRRDALIEDTTDTLSAGSSATTDDTVREQLEQYSTAQLREWAVTMAYAGADGMSRTQLINTIAPPIERGDTTVEDELDWLVGPPEGGGTTTATSGGDDGGTSGGTATGSDWNGTPWTVNDGPPWPKAKTSESINAEGTNHRKVVAPKDFDFVQDWAEFWVEDPDRHAPPGSDLARQRAASRAQSEAQGVSCQASYVKRKYGGNTRLDRLMDRGICWHYNAKVASERHTAATMRRPDGKRGAMAWFDAEGRLRWLDRYGQDQPTYEDGEAKYWEEGPALWGTNPVTGDRERLPPPESRDPSKDWGEPGDPVLYSPDTGLVPDGGTSTGGTSTGGTSGGTSGGGGTVTTTTGTTVTDYAPDDDTEETLEASSSDPAPTTTSSGGDQVGGTITVGDRGGEAADTEAPADVIELPNWMLWAAGAAVLAVAWYAFGREQEATS